MVVLVVDMAHAQEQEMKLFVGNNNRLRTMTIDGLKDDPLGADYVCYNCHQQIKVEIMTIIREWDERNGLETSVHMEGELTDSLINKFYEIQLLRKRGGEQCVKP